MSEKTRSEWGDQDEWGNDLDRLRYAWTLTPDERIERNRRAAINVIALRNARKVTAVQQKESSIIEDVSP